MIEADNLSAMPSTPQRHSEHLSETLRKAAGLNVSGLAGGLGCALRCVSHSIPTLPHYSGAECFDHRAK